MFLIVGLGNPGKKYENTRHNAGFKVIDELDSLDLKNIVLVKPNTFMNESGKAIRKLIRNYELTPKQNKFATGQEIKNLIVIHDDIDLPLGKIRIVKNRGAAGHKGIQSVIDTIGTKNFIRFRIGIQPKLGKPKSPEKFVLQKFTKDEEKIVEEITKKITEAIEMFLEEGLEKTMNVCNK